MHTNVTHKILKKIGVVIKGMGIIPYPTLEWLKREK